MANETQRRWNKELNTENAKRLRDLATKKARNSNDRLRKAKWIKVAGLAKPHHYHISYHRGVWYFLDRKTILARIADNKLACVRSFIRWCKLFRDTLQLRRKYKYKVQPFDVLVQHFAAYDWTEQKEKHKYDYSEALEHATYLELMRDLESKHKQRTYKREKYEYKRKKGPPPRRIRDEDLEE